MIFLDASKVIEGTCKAHYNVHNMGDVRKWIHFCNIHGYSVMSSLSIFTFLLLLGLVHTYRQSRSFLMLCVNITIGPHSIHIKTASDDVVFCDDIWPGSKARVDRLRASSPVWSSDSPLLWHLLTIEFTMAAEPFRFTYLQITCPQALVGFKPTTVHATVQH